jgi:hypothetical protein
LVREHLHATDADPKACDGLGLRLDFFGWSVDFFRRRERDAGLADEVLHAVGGERASSQVAGQDGQRVGGRELPPWREDACQRGERATGETK